MKKLLTMLLLSIALILAACSGQTGGESGGDGPVEITYLKPGADDPDTRERVQDIIDRFEEENPDIKVKLEAVGWDNAYQKLVTGFNGGSSPDVFAGGSRWMTAFADMGALLPLTDMASEKIKEYPEALQQSSQYKDEIYAIPRAFSARSLIYRTDLIEEPPTTWEELVETAKTVQEENEGMYGFAISGAAHVSTTTQYFNYLLQNGGEVFDEEGNVTINSPEAVEALKYYTDFYTEHKVVPNPVEYNRELLPVLFKEGKIAMYVIGPWGKSLMGVDPDNEDTPYASAPLPKGKKMANILVSDSIYVSAKTEHPEESWKFIEFLTSLEEQKEFDKSNGSLPLLTEEAKDPFFKEDPYFSTFVDMIEHGEPQPMPAVWEPFQDVITTAVQRALDGEDPQTVLDDAAKEIKEQELEPK
ncbi:sugar ABC transporter substrate-binding protein [Thalassobacillus devorans]|uniref:Maltodextrin-binding protein n=1 Tax=Thalassobacillus devorans TaxID=279813 RepID=A0ABQ1NS54_9BACI|nr:sugar ABC transporter substrate-binding protein [Thalassobacillus devorans]NIK28710.1 multiple sugar transport system substrate-binding protein [Thalassobacillus devorans]GGC84143.1 sugar ABC transporter substrate-binding protein [Thalassobacillus devorans]